MPVSCPMVIFKLPYSNTPASPTLTQKKEQMVNNGLDRVVLYPPRIFFNPLQFTALSAEKEDSTIQNVPPTQATSAAPTHSLPQEGGKAVVMLLTFLYGLGPALYLHGFNYVSYSPVG